MKILHLIPSFGSGGAERQLSIIAPALADSGVECHIGYCYDGPNIQYLYGSSVHLHKFSVASNHDHRLFWQISSLIRTVKPDLVQTWLLQMDVVGGVASLLAQTPFVLSERSSTSAYPSGWKTFLRKKIGTLASAIVANSQGGMDYWKYLNVPTSIHLIRNCVIPSSEALVSIDDVLSSNPLILFAGRLSPEKNVILLLDALIRVVSIVPQYNVVMFGEGPLRDVLQSKISEANMVGRIRLGGYTRNLATWLNQAEVCVSISNFEGNPNVALEAAAEGCLLVLSDIPAHKEVFDETSAWFVEHKSMESIVNGILSALSEKTESIAKTKRAKTAVASYKLDTILDEYLKVYLGVIKSTSCDGNKIKGVNNN